MGPDQLTGVMTQVALQAAQTYPPGSTRSNCLSSGRALDETALEALEKRAEGFRQNVHLQSTAYYTSAHVLDDGVIDPRDTRDVLGMCLEIVSENGVKGNVAFGGVSRL
jgi:acetyl-CoA carboxylase carboxyltransferase component